MPYPYEILPGLWLGNAEVAAAEDTPQRYSHVLNMAAGLESRCHQHQQYLHIQLQDLDDITPHLETLCRFVCDGLKTGGQVLVHCFMGKNRSAAACLAVIARRQTISVQKAHKFLLSKAPCAPGVWFQQQIARWLGEKHPADSALTNFKQRLQMHKSGITIDPVQLYYKQFGPQPQ